MEAGACSVEICKVNSDIVQLRLDFTSFALSNPTIGVATSFALLNGALQPAAASGPFFILLTDNVMKIPSLSVLLKVLDHLKFMESTLMTIVSHFVFQF